MLPAPSLKSRGFSTTSSSRISDIEWQLNQRCGQFITRAVLYGNNRAGIRIFRAYVTQSDRAIRRGNSYARHVTDFVSQGSARQSFIGYSITDVWNLIPEFQSRQLPLDLLLRIQPSDNFLTNIAPFREAHSSRSYRRFERIVLFIDLIRCDWSSIFDSQNFEYRIIHD